MAETLEKHPIPWSVQTMIWMDRLRELENEVAGTAGSERLDKVAIAGLRDSLPKLRTRGSIELERRELSDSLARTGSVLLLQKRWDDAKPLLRECLRVREKTSIRLSSRLLKRLLQLLVSGRFRCLTATQSEFCEFRARQHFTNVPQNSRRRAHA